MFESLIEQGWEQHEKDSPGVFERTSAAIAELDDAKHVPALAGLLVHVAGEHLGRWRDGVAVLDRLAARPCVKTGSVEEQALLRSKATLLLCAGDRAAAEELIARAQPAGLTAASTRIRVLAVAASALAGQSRVEEGTRLFEEALALAAYGPEKSDPAARALAVTGNNLACALEEKKGRTAAEDRLLEMASKTGRRFWEVAGSWVEVSRAEYRLGMTYCALAKPELALEHARKCMEMCVANKADAGDMFFAHQVLAWAHRCAMEGLVPSVGPGLKVICEDALKDLRRA